ncbi:MAG: enoyl-CoA hydratase/isomerase family protein [Cohaesibacteraceae bacterium]|nr:enoyl-CoA hydratase/isomerase family protein [Cohaesibacteraceae bacterium]
MTNEILFEVVGQSGVITLNRPKALNALTHNMVKELFAKLVAWKTDGSIDAVVVKSASEKAFCAGGDIRYLYDQGLADHPPFDFFADEYRLNHLIHNYPKPYISLINGIVMGGGFGISAHGSHRIAGEKISFAMPEVGIGFFPDVGGTYFLPRMHSCSGYYCALTGIRIKRSDCLASGFATHAVSFQKFDEIEHRLASGENIDGILVDLQDQDVAPAQLFEHRDTLVRCFSQPTLVAVIEELENTITEFANTARETMLKKSPSSLVITFAQLGFGSANEFEACLQLEYRIVHRIMKDRDFYEGVRAVIVDKDHNPDWSPGTIKQVSNNLVEEYFAPLDAGDLSFQI